MNKPQNPNQTLIQLILRAQLLAQQDVRAERGYAMMMTSIISIVMLSMLAAYTTMTNLSKSSTNAYVDGTNSFYAAESGLNKRAEQARQKFLGYSTPSNTTGIPDPTNISSCFSNTIVVGATPSPTNDFECRNFQFRYNNNAARVNNNNGNEIVLSEDDNNTSSVDYLAYTYVKETTDPNNIVKLVPPGENYSGLNVLEYRYTVFATAAKKDQANPANSVASGNAKTVLQMDFKSRVIPLFQFAAFFDGDLELHSGTPMNIGGRVHTNSNLYVQPISASPTTFTDRITSAGGIFRRVDVAAGSATFGNARLQLTPPVGTTPATYLNFPSSANAYLTTSPIDLTATTISGMASVADSNTFKNIVKDKTSGIVPLRVPNSGFLRKRNYYKSSIASSVKEKQLAVGEYWAKADMRLELVPDRDAVGADGVTPLTAAQGATAISTGQRWNRNEAIIPFNFTSIQAGTGTSTCTFTPPDAGSDPVATYVDPDRNGASSLKCNIFSKGQLQSLRQPVMVRTDINQLDTSIDHTNAAITGSESKTLGKPALPPMVTLTGGANTDDTKKKILRALQVAIASTPAPLPVDLLSNIPLSSNDPVIGYGGTNANFFRTEFIRLIGAIPEVVGDTSSFTALQSASPGAIAALRSAWFLPAPIQRLTSDVDITTGRANTNIRSSGFYDSREKRWITMLQTNIKSLTVWNRDGLYVDADNETMTVPYTAATANRNLAFNNGLGANFTTSRAFISAPADTTQPAGTFKRLGLGSTNITEGGLVFHATVSDDLNGDGVTTDVTTVGPNASNTDASTAIRTSTIPYELDIRNNIKYEKEPDGITNKLDSAGNPIPYTLDYHRQYWSGSAKQSPFGFAFNGGDFLPAPMSIATDQGIYIQGDFNQNSKPQTSVSTSIIAPNDERLPAAIMADTITILSNQCIATDTSKSATNHLGVYAGQIRCGLPRAANGSINLIQGGNTANAYGVTAPNAVNAAFLSYTDRSAGNCTNVTSDGTYKCGTNVTTPNPTKASGGLNNYIRMLEDWQVTGAAQYFNYSGSFVSLGTPVEYSGLWSNRTGLNGNGIASPTWQAYYNIPSRNYNFDSKFTSYNNLPPITPKVTYLQQDVFKRNFSQ